MEVFASTDELNAIMKKLWTDIANHEEMSGKLLQSRLIVRFKYTNPNGQITIDGSDGKKLNIYVGECDLEPNIEMMMKAEVANDFWTGKLNVPAALVSGKIKSHGPVHRALALLPA